MVSVIGASVSTYARVETFIWIIFLHLVWLQWRRKALTIARRQDTRSLELRASMSLARLWQSQDKKTEAYALLSVIYGWFTEGFGTLDLIEAKALLDGLARTLGKLAGLLGIFHKPAGIHDRNCTIWMKD